MKNQNTFESLDKFLIEAAKENPPKLSQSEIHMWENLYQARQDRKVNPLFEGLQK